MAPGAGSQGAFERERMKALRLAALLAMALWLAPGQARTAPAPARAGNARNAPAAHGHTVPEAPSPTSPYTHVLAIELNGAVTPSMDDALRSALERADAEHDVLLVRLDTPGGLESTMREMIKRLLASEAPVILWVTPAGAHAASAGVLLVMASDLAVMSPGTNIGAATPISMTGPMDSTLARKVTNDAAALARSVALQRGRNADWAEQAVRRAVAANEREAVTLRVVDFIAADEADLLAKADGRTYRRGERLLTLHTRGASVTHLAPDFRQRLLRGIADPNVAYLLMMLGFYGLIFEMQNPGAILPGVVGGISLLLSFFALSTLPVNSTGVALLVLGLAFLLAEIKVHSHGLLAVGGAVALLLGGLMLFKADTLHVALPVLVGCTAATVLFFLGIVGAGMRAQQMPVTTGASALVGRHALVVERLAPAGRVRIDGEVWNAVAEAAAETGSEVKILGTDGLTLRVRPAHKEG
jgi:membrane-bound serine protease (ClpP class)